MGLIKKAYEYSKLCDADVCLGIQLRGSSHVFTFLSNPAGFWSKFDSLLIRNMRAQLCHSILTKRQGNILPTASSQNRGRFQDQGRVI